MLKSTPTAALQHQSTDTEAFLKLVHPQGEVFEIRCPNCPQTKGSSFRSTWSGFFDNPAEAAKWAAGLDRLEPVGVYVTANPVRRDMLAIRRNTCGFRVLANQLANKDAILTRHWLVLDIDPAKNHPTPSHVSATDAEHAAALELAERVRDHLAADGWPDAILCSSGNGAYLWYRIDLPNSDESESLIKRVLACLGDRFDTDGATIDRKTFDASRIFKVIGTTARKGEDFRGVDGVEARPHRQSWYEPPACELTPVPVDLLEAVAAADDEPGGGDQVATRETIPYDGSSNAERCWKYIQKVPDAISGNNGHDKTFRAACECFRFGLSDPEAWGVMQRFNAEKTGSEQWSERDLQHKIENAKNKVIRDGEFGVRLRRKDHQKETAKKPKPEDIELQQGCRVLCGDRGNIGTVVKDNGRTATIHFVSPTGTEATKELPKSCLRYQDGRNVIPGPKKEIAVVSARKFAVANYRPNWLVKRILVAKQPAVTGGRSKAMKTSILVDLAVSIGSGTPFLGQFDSTRASVAILSGESGPFTIQETAKRVAAARKIDLADTDVHFGFVLPRITNMEDVEATADMLLRTKADVLIIDPAYLCLLGGENGGRQASNVFDMGPLLLRLSEVGEQTDSTVVLCHHCRKSPGEGRDRYEPPDLEELSMAGFAEWARQWILIGRREPFEPGTGNHKLWLNVGGSVGFSGTWSLDIDEGVLADDFSGRRWEVTVGSVQEAREEKKRKADQKRNEERERREWERQQKVIRILRASNEGMARTRIGIKAGMNGKHVAETLLALEQKGLVKSIPGKSGNQKCDLYFLVETSPDMGKPDKPDKQPGLSGCPS